MLKTLNKNAKSYIWSSTFKGEHPISILKELCSSLSKIHMYNNEDISTKKNRSIRNRWKFKVLHLEHTNGDFKIIIFHFSNKYLEYYTFMYSVWIYNHFCLNIFFISTKKTLYTVTILEPYVHLYMYFVRKLYRSKLQLH